MYGLLPLAETGMSVSDFAERYSLEFEEYIEDGLGECFAAFVVIDELIFFLRGHIDRDNRDPGVIANIQGNNCDPKKSLDSLWGELGILSDQSLWFREDLSKPRWVLSRQGDDGNEIEMTRFLEKHIADWVAQQYAKRGHKQIYLVRELT